MGRLKPPREVPAWVKQGYAAPKTCEWPHGNPKTPGFHFCGAPSLPGKPYCEEHYARAYKGVPPRTRKPNTMDTFERKRRASSRFYVG